MVVLKYYNIQAYSVKMDLIRSGGTINENSSYDPNKDMMAHSSSLRRPVVETETYLSKQQLEDLRRVQNERVEFGKRKVCLLLLRSLLAIVSLIGLSVHVDVRI